ncbi:MAG: response regulator [Oscillospiraceae bacterium]|nr:response regulator [Oscillospiraceae bacterium]
MQNPDEFANIIKELRIKKGLSQQQLAEQMMVSRSAVSMWELGSRVPDINMLGRLADCLGVERRILLDAIQSDPGENVNIIVVEDIPMLLHSAVRLIESELPEVNIAGFESGAEALDYARLNRVSVAFLDIELDDEMNGLELANKLLEIYPHTNIIFLTNFADYMTQAIYDHCSGYILKPLSRERVRHELANLRFPVRGLES